jgi:uncharacterized YigZ family protein
VSILFRTVKEQSEIRIEINRSLFIGHVARVESEEAATSFINQVKKAHRDANHNCSAYIIGKHSDIQKADDDGEPSGTAGKPILEVLKKQNLTNTVIVVTRYFGGIKLGAGGLIRAYGRAASEAVCAAGIVEIQPHLRLAVSCDYSLLAILENHLRNHGYIVTDKTFSEQATLYVLRRPDDTSFDQQIADWTSGLATLQEAGVEYVEVAI